MPNTLEFLEQSVIHQQVQGGQDTYEGQKHQQSRQKSPDRLSYS